MALLQFLSLIFAAELSTSVWGALQCQYLHSNNFHVNDTAQIGDIIHDFGEQLVLGQDCPYFNVSSNGTALLLNTILRDPCTHENTMGCTVKCQGANGVNEYKLFVVIIIKVDLHPPTFPSTVYTANVNELSSVGTEVFVFDVSNDSRATDEDCDTVINYSIAQNDGGNFSMTYSGAGRVVTNGTILYDSRDTYTLHVRAESTGRFANATLVIMVLDVDDKNPAFTEITYHLNVTEEEVASLPVSTSPPIFGYDLDVGINVSVLYAFEDMTTVSSYFSINATTGQLTQTTPFDKETVPSWSTGILCYQSDDASKRASAYIAVNVLDTNDHLPVFSSPFLHTTVTLTENAVGVVTTVQATDEDEGMNAVIQYRIVQEGDAFSVDQTSGVISVKTSTLLDRERTENLTILVQAVDLFGNISAENASVLVTLLDVNDNSPIFEQDQYTIILNNSVVNTVIGKVVAKDDDVPGTANSNVTYELVNSWTTGAGANTPFPLSVDSLIGDLVVTSAVTVGAEYNMLVQACDNPVRSTDRRCSFVNVLIMYSFNTTESVEISINMTVFENVPLNTFIGQLPLTGDRYNITTTDFQVDQQNHMLKTNSMIDREDRDTYNFAVQVLSRPYGYLGTISVTVTVLDINDHQPVFDQQEYFFKLPLQGQGDVLLGTLEAEDKDIEENGNLSYSLNQNPWSEWLILHPQTGNLSLAGQWWETGQGQSLYVLTATVRDDGVPSLHSTVQVFVSNIDIVDNSSVVILVDTNAEEIAEKIQQLQRDLSAVLGFAQVIIEDVQEVTGQQPNIQSRISVSAMDENDDAVPSKDIARSLMNMWYSVQSLFRSPVTPVEHSDTGLRITEIALIVVGGAILIGGAIAIPLVCKQWDKHVKEHQLYDHLRRPSTIYDSQELHMNFAEENPRSQFSSFRSSPRKEESTPMEGSFGLGYISPVFVDDDGTAPKTPTWGTSDQPRIPRWSTTDSLKDVMASLEDLSNRLNAEDNISGVTELSRGRRSLKSNKSEASTTQHEARLADWNTVDSQHDGDYITPVADYPLDDSSNAKNDERKHNGEVFMITNPKELHEADIVHAKAYGHIPAEKSNHAIEESTAF